MFGSAHDGAGSAGKDKGREELTIGAFWQGSVVTNYKGLGQFKIETPDRTSSYRILVRGMTTESLSGEFESSATVRKDITVDVKMPASLIEGDRIKALIYLHNNSSYEGDITVSGSIGEGRNQENFSLSMKVSGPGVFSELLSEYEVPPCKLLAIKVQAKSKERIFDSIVKTSSVRMWGITKEDCSSGKVVDGEKIKLTIPDSINKETVNLEISLFANHGQELISLLKTGYGLSFDIPSRAARTIATCLIIEKIRKSNLNKDRIKLLQTNTRSLISSLKMCQNSDGSWPIVKSRDNRYIEGDRVSTSLSIIAINLASKIGFTNKDSNFSSGISWLKANNSNYESFGGFLSLLALACCGEADFSVLNRLNRMAESLSHEGKALLGLAFCQMDKVSYANSLAQSLVKELKASINDKTELLRPSETNEGLSDTAKVLLLWLLSTTEDSSLDRSKLAREVRQMLSSFFGLYGWMRWTAVGVMASNINEDEDLGASSFEVKVRSSERILATWNSKKDKYFKQITLSAEELEGLIESNDGKRRTLTLDLGYSGKGNCTYELRLSGTSPVIEKERNLNYSIDSEDYYHSPRLYKGRALTQSKQMVDSVSIEDYVEDYLSFESFDEGIETGSYVLVTRSIPSGMVVDESSIPSQALAVSTSDGKLHLVFKGKPSAFRLSLMPSCPGTYRVLPSELKQLDSRVNADNCGKERQIRILSTIEMAMKTDREKTEYQWSTNEHLAFGEAFFNDKEYEKAVRHLKTIPATDYKFHRNASKALLWIYCESEFYSADNIIELFEVLEQHHSSVVIPYEKLLIVGKAYHDKGEYEAATMLWRSTLQSAFRDEFPVVKELEEAGEYLRSISFAEDLYWSYPNEPTIIQSYYGLSQDVYRHKEEVDSIRETGNETDLETANITSDDLVQKAAELLQQFLTFHGDLPYSDQATFSLLSAYLELRLDENCLTLASRSIDDYKKSEYCDRFKYLKALAAFNLGKFDLAIDSAAQVADCDSSESEYATFILGQMYQAMGRMDNALKAYRRIKENFADAELSIHYIERQSLKMEEIVTGFPGQSVSIDLRYCNAEKIEVLAYKVDLMRLFLKEKNLDRIANVNLAGITPTCTFERSLPEVPRGTTGKTTIDLPFENTGAYLVLVRSKEAFASGLVLITPLSMEIQETQDAVRATILEGKKMSPVRDVYVKASNGSDFKDDSTDLRGAATIEIEGGEGLTVVARRGKDEYAFFRSKTDTGEIELPWFDVSEKVSYNSSILEDNEMVQQEVASNLQNNFRRRKKNERGLQANQIRL
jgi:tetratricopeptide (TPR) repeat protein